MKILALYANPKDGGFVHGCLDLICDRLRQGEASMEAVHLRELGIRDCTGCLACLHDGLCPLDDGMNDLCERLRSADALVLGCSVRMAHVTALYQRFLERITFPLIFTGDLAGKYVLSVAAVGQMGGGRATRRLLGLRPAGTCHTRHLFFRVGLPSRLEPRAVSSTLELAADDLLCRMRDGRRPGPLWRLARRIDRWVLSRLLFARNPELYAHPIRRFRQRGWM